MMPTHTAKRCSNNMTNGRRKLSAALKLSSILTSAAIAGFPLMAVAGNLPSGGQVTAGSATITSSGNATTVNQTSNYAIVNWDTFSIGAGGKVDFRNGSGATLNRVTGSQVSTIDGKLSSTGSVYLINANGVVVGTSGVITVGGSFVASTQNVSDANFLKGGDLTFAGSSVGSVVNLGSISSGGGNIVLIAQRVENDGTLSAKNGTVGLAAGYSVLLSDASNGDGVLQVQIGGSGTSVQDTGSIAASIAELRAQGGNIFALAGNTQALIQATGVNASGGKIYLTAGTGGSVSVAGSLLKASSVEGGGGDITLAGQTVDIASNASLDASAASSTGNGGRISAVADMTNGSLTFNGSAIATAGKAGGDGGFVETSGASVIFAGATVDTSARNGQTGIWLTDPYDLTVDSNAAATIANNLATTNVVLQTTASGTSGSGVVSSGDGDIVIDAPISWSSSNALTLDAYHSVLINANLTVSGSGGVVITTNDGGGSGGDYIFARGASLQFTGPQFTVYPTLTINGAAYGLAYNLDELGSSNDVALATSITDTTTHSASLVYLFSGTFEGLGNTITNLTINSSGWEPALISQSSGTIRDIGLINVSVTGSGSYSPVGALVATNTGTIKNAWASGAVTGSAGTNVVGGLVGSNDSGGTVSGSFANVAVSIPSGGIAGGLVGHNGGTVTTSYATGTVSAADASTVGGLVGSNDNGGSISVSFATGDVTSTGYSPTGGLVGANGGMIANTFATGSVTSGGGLVGGLVGTNTVTDYPPPNYSPVTYNGSITNSYATGAVTAIYAVGGLVGANGTGTVTDGYYDYMTTGQASGTQSDGSQGLSTVALQGTLPSGFSNSIWSTGAGLYPYLTSLFDVVSGTAYNANGTTASSASVGIYSGGVLLNGTTTTSTANGLFSEITPWGALISGKLGVSLTLSGDSSVSGLSYTDAPTILGQNVSAPNVTSGAISASTTETAYSALQADLTSTYGSTAYASMLAGLSSANLTVKASGSFTIDQAVSGGEVSIAAAGGDLTLASGGSVSATGTGDAIVLAANGSFINNASSSAVSAANGNWLIYSQATGSASSAPTGDVQGGLAGVSYYGDAFNFATGAFATTPTGNRFVYGYQPTLLVTPNTTTVTYSGSTQIDGYSINGYLGSDQAADSLTGTVSGLTTTSKNATAYGLTASGSLTSAENYAVAYGTGTLIISPAALTLTAVTNTKTYDGTTSAVATPTVSGLVGSDSITGLFEAYSSKNVLGTGGSTLSVDSGVSVNDGNGGANYTISVNSAFGTITPASLSLSAVTDTKVYDGTTTSSQSPTITGLVSSDNITGLSQSFDSPNAGARTLAIDGGFVIGDGNGGGNYTVTLATASGAITPATLTTLLTGSVSKTYDGTTAASLTASNYDLSGVVSGDSVSLNDPTSGIYANKNAGTGIDVTASGLVLSGADAGNYVLASAVASGNIGVINPATLTALLTGSVSKTYDGTIAANLTASNYDLSGVVSGDSVSLNDPTSGTYASKNAGNEIGVTVAGLGLSGASASNYVLSDSSITATVGTINQADLSVSANDLSKFVGQADPALTYAVTGTLYDGDTLTGSLSRASGQLPGHYAIAQGSLAASSNYDLVFTPGVLVINATGHQDDIVVIPNVSQAGPLSQVNAFTSQGQTNPQGDTACSAPTACPYPDNRRISSNISFTSH